MALDLGFFQLRWYALSYIAMIADRLVVFDKAAAAFPVRRWRGAISMTSSSTPRSGIILGGRLGYCLFYRPEIWLHPLDVLKLWEGGMSLHGGFLGVIIALWLFTRRHGLSMLRVCDYFACATPFGLILVRLANFVNGELWGRPSSLPWAMIFPGTHDGIPRHPSQLYEALFEGVLTMVVLVYLFWRTDARLRPGRLTGTGLVMYGTAASCSSSPCVSLMRAGASVVGLNDGANAQCADDRGWRLAADAIGPIDRFNSLNTDERFQARPSSEGIA